MPGAEEAAPAAHRHRCGMNARNFVRGKLALSQSNESNGSFSSSSTRSQSAHLREKEKVRFFTPFYLTSLIFSEGEAWRRSKRLS